MSSINWGDFSPKERSLYKAAINEMARSFIAGLYEEGLADPEGIRHLGALSKKLEKIKAGENPFLIYHAWSRPLRQLDFLNWRLSGGTLRRANRRAKRVARGGIATELYEARGEAEEALEAIEAKVPCRDLLFPRSFEGDEALDRFVEKRDCSFDIEGTNEVRLEANPVGSWAIYRLEADGCYTRTFMMREVGFKPLYGAVKKEVRYG